MKRKNETRRRTKSKRETQNEGSSEAQPAPVSIGNRLKTVRNL
jgi:hypothetical protein